MKNQRGFTLVEAVIAVAVFGIVLLGAVQGFMSLSKTFTHSRVKSQALQFAKGELENFQKIARIPERDLAGMVPPNPKPIGFTNFVVASDETQETYPRQFFDQGTATSDEERLTLFRKVEVSTVNVNTPAEYRLVKVTLRDSVAPARFSPISVQTIIKKPASDALDIRTALGVVNISGTITDVDTTNGIEDVTVTIGTGTYLRTSDTNEAGEYQFLNYIASQVQTYTIESAKAGYWPSKINNISLAGLSELNNLNGTMQKVYVTTVTVNVADLLDGASPLENATVEISFRNGAPPAVPAPFVNQPTYTALTNASGNATFNIPIPVNGQSTYTGYYIKKVSKFNYFYRLPNQDITIDRDAEVNANFQLVEMKFGNYAVTVTNNDAAPSPLQHAHVEILDYDTNQVILTGQNSENRASGSTDASGKISFTFVPVNSNLNPNATTRKVKLNIQRLTYQRILAKQESNIVGNNNRMVTENVDVAVTKQLTPQSWNLGSIKLLAGKSLLINEDTDGDPATTGIDFIFGHNSTIQIPLTPYYKGHGISPSDFTAITLDFLETNSTWSPGGSCFSALDLPAGSITNLNRSITYSISRKSDGSTNPADIGELRLTSTGAGANSVTTDAQISPFYRTPLLAAGTFVDVNLTVTVQLQFDYSPAAGLDPYGPQTIPFTSQYTTTLGDIQIRVSEDTNSLTTFINGDNYVKADTTESNMITTSKGGVTIAADQYTIAHVYTPDVDGNGLSGLNGYSIDTTPEGAVSMYYYLELNPNSNIGEKFNIRITAMLNSDPTCVASYERTYTVLPNVSVSIAPAGPINMGYGASQTFTATIAGAAGAANLHWQVLNSEGGVLSATNNYCSISNESGNLTTTLTTSPNEAGIIYLQAYLQIANPTNGTYFPLEYSNKVQINILATGSSVFD